ncbi:MAG: hypothetical protein VW124_27445, partial [Paracoccaceae bacterium]
GASMRHTASSSGTSFQFRGSSFTVQVFGFELNGYVTGMTDILYLFSRRISKRYFLLSYRH